MNILIGTVLIWIIALWLLAKLKREQPDRLPVLFTRAKALFLFILPRIFIGLVGAGFLAALLPADSVQQAFGRSAGLSGVLLATAFGAITPGGPFTAFAIAAAAYKAGAGLGAILAYVTGWSFVCLIRTISYETSFLGAGFAMRRVLISLPFAVLLGIAGLLLEA